MPRSGVLIGAVVLGVAALFGAGMSGIDGSGGYAGLSPRFLPTVVATGLALCGLLILAASLGGRFVPAVEAQKAGDRPAAAGAWRRLGWLIGGLMAHLLLIGHLGFVAASVLLMICVARGYGSRRPGRDALVGLAIALPVWALFAHVMGIGLPFCPLLGR